MIANSGFFDGYPRYTSGTVIYTISAPTHYASSFTLWLPPMDEDTRRTARHIPFYRALFDQDFPPLAPPKWIAPERERWKPNMGRVRVDRSLRK